MTTQETQKKDPVSIPYFAHEGDMYRAEQVIKKLTLAMICNSITTPLLAVLQYRQQHKE